MPAVGYKGYLIAALARQDRLLSRCRAMLGISSRHAGRPVGTITPPRDFITQADAEHAVSVKRLNPVETPGRLSSRSRSSKPIIMAQTGFTHRVAEASPDDASPMRLLVLAVLIGGAYYVGALLGFALTFPDDAVSTLWPPNAILLAALLLTPTRTWWAILLGVLPAHFAVQLQTGVPILMILCWFISNCTEAVMGAFLVRSFIHGRLQFDSFQHVVTFVVFAVLLAPFVTSFLDAGFVVLNRWRQVDFWSVWSMRFPANAVAALTLVPAIVLWGRGGSERIWRVPAARWLEQALLIVGLFSVSIIVFGWQSAGPSTLPALVYMPLPFLLWAAVRLGPLGSSTSILILTLLSIWGTVHGSGPFISSSPAANAFSLQLFLFFVALPLLFFAALLEERRRGEETRAQAAAIVESSADAIIGGTLDGTITSWNRGAEKLFGYSAQEIVGRPVTILMPPDHADAVSRNVDKINRGEGIQSYETIRMAKGGRAIHVSVTVSPVKDESGRVTGISSITRDITERKRAEEALRQSEEWLRLAAEGSQLGVWHWDEQTQELTWDATTREIFGAPAHGKVSLDMFYNALHPDDLERVKKTWTRALEAGLPYRIELRVQRADGSVRWLHARGKGYSDTAGNPVRMIGIVLDITERKLAEEELRQALMEVRRLKGQLELDNVYLREELSQAHRYGEMVGESNGIQKVFEQVEQVALTDMTVLILGETGTGKELVARLVHGKSGRRERPLVKVNCSTLPAELIESELFGHERGAFTGAVTKQVGRFELADGGTIFLDEVGELPLGLQVKLLRVLQEGEFERLGSAKTIKVNVRVIAATNRNLREAAQQGRFREDLYYRLNVYPIEIPPLRERRGDIGLLGEMFLQETGRRLGRSFGKIPKETVEALRAYSWPGNVRELENVIARAAIMSTAPTLQLPEGWNRGYVKSSFSQAATEIGEPLPMFQRESQESTLSLEQLERARILEVLYQTNWRIQGPKGAALILGLHPNTLRSRLRKLGIRKPSKLRNSVVETTK